MVGWCWRWLRLALIAASGMNSFNMHGLAMERSANSMIPFPWTALNVSADGDGASVARRHLQWGKGPLPASISADGQPLLASPPSVDVSGQQRCTWSPATLQHSSPAGTALAATWASRCVEPAGTPTVAAHATTTLHVDGWLTCDMVLAPHIAEDQHASVNVTLHLTGDANLYNHAMVGWNSEWNGRFNNRKRPQLEWWSGQIPPTGFNLSFTPQLWVGNGAGRGVAFLADGPTNWSLPMGMHERPAMFVSRTADTTVLTVTFVEPTQHDNRTYAPGSGRHLRFSLMPTPVRPIDDSRPDLRNPKISPAMGWIENGQFNENLVVPGALADPGPLSAMAGNVSIALWIRLDQPQESMFIAGNGYLGLGLGLPSQNLSVAMLDALGDKHVFSTVAHSVVVGRWFHVMVAFAQSKHLTIYVDGRAIHTESVGFTFQSGPSQFTLCGAALENPVSELVGHRSWHGAVAELLISDHVFNASETRSLHGSGVTSGSATAAMIGRWSFSLDQASHNHSYATSLWPSLPLASGASASLALVLNSQASSKLPASFAPGVVVAGPNVSQSSEWALRLEGHLVQMTGNERNVTLLEYTKRDLQFDFVIIWEDWSNIWGFPGITDEKYKISLRRLVAEAHKVGLRVLPYIDISQLSERAPGFAEVFEAVKLDEGGKQHPANFSDQPVHEIDSASPAWGRYWNDKLRSFVVEFPEVDGFYCDEAGLQGGINDENGRADYKLGGARAVFAEMYEILHAAGMILIQDNSVPATVTHNYRTDILLTGEIHYMLLQYHNRTAVGGRPLLERIPPQMAQSWWNFARVNVPTVFDTKAPSAIIHNSGEAPCPGFSCGWDRQKIVTTSELEMITGLHGMSLWGPVNSNADGTSWLWWQALQTVGCHHASRDPVPVPAPLCDFRGYWESSHPPQAHHNAQHLFVSFFEIRRGILSVEAAADDKELLLLVANYGEHPLFHTSAAIPGEPIRRSNESGWMVKQTWPSGSLASVDQQTGMLIIEAIQQHQLQFVHLI